MAKEKVALQKNTSGRTILKNTLYLYIRMFLAMALSLYTSRVVLDVLGVEDFGLYNVIAGIIVLLTILNNSMVSSTQRFITFEIGTGDEKRVSDTFSMSMTVHIGICILLLVLGETIGLWYINNYLSIPEGRETAAMWVYQLSLLNMVANILRSPYNASIISYEHMSFYAVISIVEMVLKLLIVFLLVIAPFDKLISFSVLGCITTIGVTLGYKWYCQRKFSTCNYYYYIEPSYFKKIMSFLGWNLVGGISTLGTQQAGNLIINAFNGVVVNAAYGVGNQVSAALNQFVNNFQTAFRPQIVKSYAQNDMSRFYRIMNRSALMSYYLLLIVGFPILLNIDLVLSIWLKVVPQYAGIFCQILIIIGFIDALQAPLWIGISASGNIRAYQIWTSLLFMLNIPFAYICLKNGMAPYWVLVVRLIIGIISAVLRTIHVKFQLKVSVKQYLSNVILRVIAVTSFVLVFWHFTHNYFPLDSLWGFMITYIVLFVLSCIVVYTIGVDKQDRLYIKNIVIGKLKQLLAH